MLSSPRIVFFGTPDFAVGSLERLVAEGYPVVGVVTAPDRPAGRGLKEKASAVKIFALRNHIPVLQPEKMKDPGFLGQLSALNPDLQIVIAFRMMPRAVWLLPPLGTFNLHASLLPQYRGAAPINHAIINGERETGVTTFFINDQIDTGQILLTTRIRIGAHETAGELHDRLMVAGAQLVTETVQQITRGTITPVSQESLIPSLQPLKSAPKIFRDSCRINWDQEVATIHNFIRGLSPHPGAFTEIILPGGEKSTLRIYKTMPERITAKGRPGTFLTDGTSYLKVQAQDGFIHLIEIQLSGRKVMNTGEFLRGYRRIFPETFDS
jgi:methionyl-tRNA formyltransferase